MFTEEETRRWLLLRAIEWNNWPSFVSQPILPVVLIFYPWYYALGGVFVMDLIWATIRYRFVSIPGR